MSLAFSGMGVLAYDPAVVMAAGSGDAGVRRMVLDYMEAGATDGFLRERLVEASVKEMPARTALAGRAAYEVRRREEFLDGICALLAESTEPLGLAALFDRFRERRPDMVSGASLSTFKRRLRDQDRVAFVEDRCVLLDRPMTIRIEEKKPVALSDLLAEDIAARREALADLECRMKDMRRQAEEGAKELLVLEQAQAIVAKNGNPSALAPYLNCEPEIVPIPVIIGAVPVTATIASTNGAILGRRDLVERWKAVFDDLVERFPYPEVFEWKAVEEACRVHNIPVSPEVISKRVGARCEKGMIERVGRGRYRFVAPGEVTSGRGDHAAIRA